MSAKIILHPDAPGYCKEEVKKQVKTAFAQNNIERIVTRNISKWDLREAVKEGVRDYVKSDIKVSVKIEEGVSE